MSMQKTLGDLGEDRAEKYVRELGWTILDRNWRCRTGEIDIIALDGETVVIIEVKTRSHQGCGHPFEAVTPRKVARLRRLAVAWCREHRAGFPAIRFDVIAVQPDDDGELSIEHLAGVQ